MTSLGVLSRGRADDIFALDQTMASRERLHAFLKFVLVERERSTGLGFRGDLRQWKYLLHTGG